MLNPILSAQLMDMQSGMLVLYICLGLILIGCVVLTILRIAGRRIPALLLVCTYLVLVLCIICTLLCFARTNALQNVVRETTMPTTEPATEATTEATTEEVTTEEATTEEPTTEEPTTEEPTTEEPTTEEPTTEPEPTFIPTADEDSDPQALNITWEIFSDGEIVEEFEREDTVSFSEADTYWSQAGIPGFRGNNWRTEASYGITQVTDGTLTSLWRNGVGSLDDWPGVGWTGQPLIVQWDQDTKNIMGLYEEKKTKEGLVEVISTTLDGNIYFADLEDGSYTRDPIYIGQSVKGTAALDPRGYPLLYVGSGLNHNGYPKMFIISLIDNSILYTQGGGDPFANRGWYAFDSSPLICGEADTLIWPGESGVIYSFKLNTQFDPEAGTLTIDPENVAKVRYKSSSNRTIGFESSLIVVDHYGYIGDNGGLFFCFDVNTMELIWCRDLRDDINATPVFNWEDGHGYLYICTSMEYGGGTSYIYKLDAQNGQIIWEKSYSGIIYDKDVSGGILSSPVLGREGTDLEGLLITCVSKAPTAWQGIFAALDIQTGEVVWEKTLNAYAWSSPVAVYDENGTGHLILGDSNGTVYLMNSSGETLSTINLGSIIEAAPAVFNNTLVISTRAGSVWGIAIK